MQKKWTSLRFSRHPRIKICILFLFTCIDLIQIWLHILRWCCFFAAAAVAVMYWGGCDEWLWPRNEKTTLPLFSNQNIHYLVKKCNQLKLFYGFYPANCKHNFHERFIRFLGLFKKYFCESKIEFYVGIMWNMRWIMLQHK